MDLENELCLSTITEYLLRKMLQLRKYDKPARVPQSQETVMRDVPIAGADPGVLDREFICIRCGGSHC